MVPDDDEYHEDYLSGSDYSEGDGDEVEDLTLLQKMNRRTFNRERS